MNGVLNIIAALVLGGAVVYAGHSWTQNSSSQTMSKSDMAAFKNNTINEVKQKLAQSGQCVSRAELDAAKGSCSDSNQLGGLEQPYAAGVAVSELQSEGDEAAKDRLAAFTGQGGGPAEDDQAVDSQAMSSAAEEAMQADEMQADKKAEKAEAAMVDKPDSKEFFTENKRLMDKPDSKEFFTENKRLIDKPDSNEFFTENKRLIDKPDDGKFFTDNKRMNDEPCLRADGSAYTGPGTAQDPFAEDNPCLGAPEYAENTPFGIDPATDPDPYSDPCLTGSARTSGDFLGEGDPCVTDVQIADLPQTSDQPPAVGPLPPVTLAQTPQTPRPWYVSPYQDFGGPRPGFGGFGPQPTIPRGGSDYPVQTAMMDY